MAFQREFNNSSGWLGLHTAPHCDCHETVNHSSFASTAKVPANREQFSRCAFLTLTHQNRIDVLKSIWGELLYLPAERKYFILTCWGSSEQRMQSSKSFQWTNRNKTFIREVTQPRFDYNIWLLFGCKMIITCILKSVNGFFSLLFFTRKSSVMHRSTKLPLKCMLNDCCCAKMSTWRHFC